MILNLSPKEQFCPQEVVAVLFVSCAVQARVWKPLTGVSGHVNVLNILCGMMTVQRQILILNPASSVRIVGIHR